MADASSPSRARLPHEPAIRIPHELPLKAKLSMPPLRSARLPYDYESSKLYPDAAVAPAKAGCRNRRTEPEHTLFTTMRDRPCGMSVDGLQKWVSRRQRHLALPVEQIQSARGALPFDSNSETSTPRLPAVLASKKSPSACPADVGLNGPYRWIPSQVIKHTDMDKDFFSGVYVNTLSLGLQIGRLAAWEQIELASEDFYADGPIEICHIESNLVLCRGLIVSVCRTKHNTVIARFPDKVRPTRPLSFAVLCENRHAAGLEGHGLSLATLMLTVDGSLSLESCAPGLVLDLSGVRFATGQGIAIIDEVRAISCDVGGRRFAVLQGKTSSRVFEGPGKTSSGASHTKPLALIPSYLTPQSSTAFIVPGHRSGSFHLVKVNQVDTTSAHLVWSDSHWMRDVIELTGVLFEVAPEAVKLSSDMKDMIEKRIVVIMAFQALLKRRCTTIEQAWSDVFDLDSSGQISYSEFVTGCKVVGYLGNVGRVWSMLDEDGSGEITLGELLSDPRPE